LLGRCFASVASEFQIHSLFFTLFQSVRINPEFALGIPEIIGGRVKRVKK
jgi:hypothetical protein